jgi:hypothetical protein
VLFALGVVYLAGGMTRLAGWVTLLASAVILTLSLIDAAFTIAAAEAVIHRPRRHRVGQFRPHRRPR